MADHLDSIGVLGYEEERIEAQGPDRKCRYCKAPIFFAKTRNGKWMALDVLGVRGTVLAANDREGETRARAMTLVDAAQGRHVVSASSRTGGIVWIPHPDVCGMKAEEPTNHLLRERWEGNRPAVADLVAEASTKMHQLLHDLDDEDGEYGSADKRCPGADRSPS